MSSTLESQDKQHIVSVDKPRQSLNPCKAEAGLDCRCLTCDRKYKFVVIELSNLVKIQLSLSSGAQPSCFDSAVACAHESRPCASSSRSPDAPFSVLRCAEDRRATPCFTARGRAIVAFDRFGAAPYETVSRAPRSDSTCSKAFNCSWPLRRDRSFALGSLSASARTVRQRTAPRGNALVRIPRAPIMI